MKTTMVVSSLLFIAGLPLSAAAESTRTTIVAAAVENTTSAEVVRLVVTPNVGNLTDKIVCGEDMIRVRLDGVSNRGQELQELSVPGKGPLRRVRIVEKNEERLVVQLYPRRNLQAACTRTEVVAMGGEITISIAYTDAEAARLNSEKEENTLSPLQASMLPAANKNADKGQAPAPVEKVEKEKQEKNGNPEATKDRGLVFKKTDSAQENDSPVTFGKGAVESPKMVLGFGFAALVAGIALYMKRKKKITIGDMNKIEILSTQRLGIRQQLMLVSVQGVKLLLAVSEKNVTSLGVISDDDMGRRGISDHQSSPQPMSVESTLESLIGEASRRAVKNDLPIDRNERPSAFNSELRRALDTTGVNTGRPESSTPYDSASNAAGLVALARMRANLKKSAGKPQVFEA